MVKVKVAYIPIANITEMVIGRENITIAIQLDEIYVDFDLYIRRS